MGLIVDDTEPPRGDWLSLFIRGIVLLGMAPHRVFSEAHLDWTSLRYAAEQFVALVMDVSSRGVFHLASEKGVPFSMLVAALQQLGCLIHDCSLLDFQNALEEHKDGEAVRVVQLATHYVLTKEMEHRQLDIFLATGSSFDDQRVYTTLGTRCPEPSVEDVRAVVLAMLKR